MTRGRLTPLQVDVLRAFFSHESDFFLTGGAALAGYHLRHRDTGDLDLFTVTPGAFERARHVMATVAVDCGATLKVIQDAPGFRRVSIDRPEGVLMVDLVRERVFQAYPEKLDMDGIRVDPADEILANKLTAIVGRTEERDLVDVMFLERAGHSLDQALAHALAKDGGCTPAQLAWLLSQVSIPDGAKLPAGVTPDELRAYLAELVKRLRKMAVPT